MILHPLTLKDAAEMKLHCPPEYESCDPGTWEPSGPGAGPDHCANCGGTKAEHRSLKNLRPRGFRWSLAFACNHHTNGQAQGFVENVRIGIGRGNFDFGTDFLDSHEIELYGDRVSFRWLTDTRFKLSRYGYSCRDMKEWVGNWCWDACLVSREVVLCVARVLKAKGWRPESGTEFMCRWWERLETGTHGPSPDPEETPV